MDSPEPAVLPLPALEPNAASKYADLQDSFVRLTNYGLRTMGRSAFAQHFPGLHPDLVRALHDMYCKVMESVAVYSQEEFEAVCKEHGVLQYLELLQTRGAVSDELQEKRTLDSTSNTLLQKVKEQAAVQAESSAKEALEAAFAQVVSQRMELERVLKQKRQSLQELQASSERLEHDIQKVVDLAVSCSILQCVSEAGGF